MFIIYRILCKSLKAIRPKKKKNEINNTNFPVPQISDLMIIQFIWNDMQ